MNRITSIPDRVGDSFNGADSLVAEMARSREKLKARAARRYCSLDDLIDRVCARARKNARFVAGAKATADEIDSALERREPTRLLWPKSLSRCLLAALIRDARFERAAEQHPIGDGFRADGPS
jgi:hypothetical protein